MTVLPRVFALLSALVFEGTYALFPPLCTDPTVISYFPNDALLCNTSANFIDRAKVLVDSFALSDVVVNLYTSAPGVELQGVPPYRWWSEALHGVAISPGTNFAPPGEDFSSATSFPEPIALGATFDDPLIHSVATVISTEARAFNNADRAGLSFFTPNINPFKDPRWGRGQETPGEDPYHISQYVYQYVTGLQGGVGPDPYFKVIADCKHFAGYDLENWNGNNRMAFNAIISTQDLAEYYTPSFKSCVRDAKVGSVMCSYNAVNGVPSCASRYLLQDVIRDFFKLGDDQWITSDCDAVYNVFNPHNYTSLVNASAVSMEAGTDLDCGTTYAGTLYASVTQGLVSEDLVRQALIRLYGSLVRLGWFDPPENQPYRQLSWSDVNTPSAQNIAYTAAVESIVLLKNDGTLPLSKSVKTIALIGPWANATAEAARGNYAGVAPFYISPLAALQSAGFNVNFVNGTGIDSNDTSGFAAAVTAAADADAIVYAGGIDQTIEAEGLDRMSITWPGNQLDLITQLAAQHKPLVVLQVSGGQVDSSSLKSNQGVNALLWAGYLSQSFGTAVVDILTGKVAPAGRLPVTQYPADYVNQIPMTDMTLRPNSSTGSPGRTYKWYTGTPVFPFGFGLHYTNFSLSWAATPKASYSIQDLLSAAENVEFTDLAPLDTFHLSVKNTGHVASDYVALLFKNSTAGPAPAPLKELVSYARAHSVAAGKATTLALNVTLGSVARVNENGDYALFPGTYDLSVDTAGLLKYTFELTGQSAIITSWPQPS
ncbi:glycoside hydrolase family 3 protein [Auriscalpium vulgare]|uniref:Glycoside hydrolase family 3 protein n=1 Tax=Auriscalpium vulgare TaxID=40419 RepID=A0ACB8S9F5_9AGAM|nr:glycoside hydrolase family 3 protein [Auriscalpium vulgare]